jgi:putative transcriptional regulator
VALGNFAVQIHVRRAPEIFVIGRRQMAATPSSPQSVWVALYLLQHPKLSQATEGVGENMKHSVFNHAYLIKRRAERGLTFEQLAALVGTSKGYLHDLEHKRKYEPSLSMACRIAKALKCSLNKLVLA